MEKQHFYQGLWGLCEEQRWVSPVCDLQMDGGQPTQ